MSTYDNLETFVTAVRSGSFAQQSGDWTILITNNSPGGTFIALPQGGNVTVGYEFQDQPAQQCYIWEQGGATTNVTPGVNNYQVSEGAALVYTLAYEGQSIKLGWFFS